VRTLIARQRGAALIVSLIMLLLITILAVTAFRLGKSNLQIIGNVQQRDQEVDAGQFAIDQTVSSLQFTLTPTNAVPNPCNGVPNEVCAAAAGGTGSDITVTVNPTCDSIQPIPVTALNFSDPNDAGCLIGAGQNYGVSGASSNNSMCSNSLWNINAKATDNVTGSVATVDEGAAVRVSSATTCP
jgi:Tfp pilus assembly protein PilX